MRGEIIIHFFGSFAKFTNCGSSLFADMFELSEIKFLIFSLYFCKLFANTITSSDCNPGLNSQSRDPGLTYS